MSARVRAPELRGRGWLNTGGKDLTLADLRGRSVLDFWTFCCINCLHVLDELRPLEEKYGDVLVVIGVHSPKFEHEKDPAALAAAVERYGVAPPGARRPRACDMWQQYAAQAWPTLVGDRPRGVRGGDDGRRGARRGAGPADRRADRHPRGEGHPAPGRRPVRPARRPGDHAALPGQGGRAARTATCWSPTRPGTRSWSWPPDGETVGAPDRLRASGAAPTAGRRRPRFSEPQGLCLLPGARRRGRRLRRGGRRHGQPPAARRASWTPARCCTVAGSGRQWRSTVDDHAHDAARRRPLLAVGPGLVRRPGDHRDGRHPPALVVRPGQAHRRHVRRHHRRGAARRPAGRRCGWRSRPGSPSPPTATGSGSPTARPAPLRYVEDGRAAHRRRAGAVRLRARGRPGRAAPAAAPAGGLRAAGRLGADRRHLQRRGAPLRPGHRRRSPRSPTGWPSRATWCSPPTARCWWSSRPRTG